MSQTNEHVQTEVPAQRVQINARMERRMVKVLKGLAEYLDIPLGELLEGVVLHSFENKSTFSEQTLKRIAQLKEVYGMDYDAHASHKLIDDTAAHVVSPDEQ